MPIVRSDQRYHHLWRKIQGHLSEHRRRTQCILQEDLSFFVYRNDTNTVLARGIIGYDEAKRRADQIRRSHGLPWSVVKFKAEQRTQRPAGATQGQPNQQRSFGVSRDGKTFINAYGQRGRVEYSPRYNPAKGRRFRGYTDADGNYHDID